MNRGVNISFLTRLLVIHLPWPLGLSASSYSDACARATGVEQAFWARQGRACVALLRRRAAAVERLLLVGGTLYCGGVAIARFLSAPLRIGRGGGP